MGETRIEHDSLGEVEVPAEALWAAQTQRSLENFAIGNETMPLEVVRALALIKRASAQANAACGVLDEDAARLIAEAADEIVAGDHADAFPLKVWQTGSGTQTNMNVNEVIATRANQLAQARGIALATPIHPNDHVNRSQSSNDAFPTAIHMAAVEAIEERLVPAAEHLAATLRALEAESEGIVKSGRTHLQDAVPISFSQEVSGWRALVESGVELVRASEPALLQLALGGTAVGTGLNAPAGFADDAIARIAEATGRPFTGDPNRFHALTSKDALVASHGALKALAANLMKLANDVRWLASGPRLGLGEIEIPANEPGSSIMPGKVNPTQAEALTMVAVQVMGNDVAIGVAASQGNFELNVFMPLIARNFLHSANLLADAIASFDANCAAGIRPVRERMAANLENSLMLVTCLTPEIGYERAAEVAKRAHATGETLREACAQLGYLAPERFDELVRPDEMV